MTDHELGEWITLSKSITDADRERHTPPPHVLDTILAASSAPSEQRPENEDSSSSLSSNFEQPSSDAENLRRSDIAPNQRRKRRRRRALASIAAVAAIVLGISLATNGDDATTLFAGEATNENLTEPFDGHALITIEVVDEQTPKLVFEFSSSLPYETPVELWVMTEDGSDIVSLGTINPGDTTWNWPSGYDPAVYRVVDVSIEPDNGDPAHSGRSILRGKLHSV